MKVRLSINRNLPLLIMVLSIHSFWPQIGEAASKEVPRFDSCSRYVKMVIDRYNLDIDCWKNENPPLKVDENNGTFRVASYVTQPEATAKEKAAGQHSLQEKCTGTGNAISYFGRPAKGIEFPYKIDVQLKMKVSGDQNGSVNKLVIDYNQSNKCDEHVCPVSQDT